VTNLDRTTSRLRTLSLQGIRLNPLSNAEVVNLIGEIIERNESRIVGNHNMHSLYLWYREPRMREFFAAADYVHIDGMAVVLLGKMAGLPLQGRDRAAYLDFLPLLTAQAAQEKWRIFFLGSEPGIAEKAAEKLRGDYPGLQMRTHHGHFNVQRSSEENRAVLAEIDAYQPHLLMVGMGMPRQEMWILENRNEIHANVICPTGAIMDYVAGTKATPPRWLGALYLEWLYRLFSEPKRLSRRYLIEPWFVMREMARAYMRGARSGLAIDDRRLETEPTAEHVER
jgi:N-acetylglucosaminyldiphosphoundecaprenol N-acetyl-beta-D-mannosaminyltransferase